MKKISGFHMMNENTQPKKLGKLQHQSQQTFVQIKMNIFALVIRFRRRLMQDQYIRLGDTYSRGFSKKSSQHYLRRLAKTCLRSLENVFKMSYKNIFETSSRRLQDSLQTSARRLDDIFKRLAKMYSNIFKTYHFNFSLYYTFQWLLAEAYLRTLSNIYNGAFFAKILKAFKLLTTFAKEAPLQMFYWVENRLLAEGLKY